MIVGVGASRVRELFAEARKVAPSIIFIDEIDAIGRARGGGVIGGHDEREQTLNQILTEMDGFSGAEGVIVIAATNRPEVLDPALLRPGRFDRTVVGQPARPPGRAAILRYTPAACRSPTTSTSTSRHDHPRHDRRRPRQPGQRGRAARRQARQEKVGTADFADALEKIAARRGPQHRDPARRSARRTAYHEAGHALLGMLQPGADPVSKISIIPRGRALGVTLPHARHRPLRLRRGVSARPDHRRARRHGGRAGRLRRHHHRRRERPGAGHHASPAAWSGAGACREQVGPLTILPDTPTASPPPLPPRSPPWTRRRGGSWTSATRRALRILGDEPRATRRHRRRPAGARDAGRGRAPTPPPGFPGRLRATRRPLRELLPGCRPGVRSRRRSRPLLLPLWPGLPGLPGRTARPCAGPDSCPGPGRGIGPGPSSCFWRWSLYLGLALGLALALVCGPCCWSCSWL